MRKTIMLSAAIILLLSISSVMYVESPAPTEVQPGLCEDRENNVCASDGDHAPTAHMSWPIVPIGTAASGGNWEFTVTAVERLGQLPMPSGRINIAPAGGEWIIVHIVLRRLSWRTFPIRARSFALIDMHCRSYRVASHSDNYNRFIGQESLETVQLPGVSRAYNLVFNVPAGSRVAALQLLEIGTLVALSDWRTTVDATPAA